MNQYEIFNSESDLNTKSVAIDVLLGYPNLETKTLKYRNTFKHKNQTLWAGVVDQTLVDVCQSMTSEECVTYYDNTDLKDHKYLKDNGWFPPLEGWPK